MVTFAYLRAIGLCTACLLILWTPWSIAGSVLDYVVLSSIVALPLVVASVPLFIAPVCMHPAYRRMAWIRALPITLISGCTYIAWGPLFHQLVNRPVAGPAEVQAILLAAALLLDGLALAACACIKRRVRGEPVCSTCGYSTTGLVGAKCPECGSSLRSRSDTQEGRGC
jgi:hypothetical protein